MRSILVVFVIIAVIAVGLLVLDHRTNRPRSIWAMMKATVRSLL